MQDLREVSFKLSVAHNPDPISFNSFKRVLENLAWSYEGNFQYLCFDYAERQYKGAIRVPRGLARKLKLDLDIIYGLSEDQTK